MVVVGATADISERLQIFVTSGFTNLNVRLIYERYKTFHKYINGPNQTEMMILKNEKEQEKVGLDGL